MKLSTMVFFLLIVAGMFFVFASMVDEANTTFPDQSQLNSSEWATQYDYVDSINDTFFPLEKSLKTLQDENAGWFSKLAEGITAIPYAILIVPQVIFGSLVYGGNMMTGFFTAWGLPQKIIVLGLVILLVWVIFKLIEYFNKTEI